MLLFAVNLSMFGNVIQETSIAAGGRSGGSSFNNFIKPNNKHNTKTKIIKLTTTVYGTTYNQEKQYRHNIKINVKDISTMNSDKINIIIDV